MTSHMAWSAYLHGSTVSYLGTRMVAEWAMLLGASELDLEGMDTSMSAISVDW